MSFLTIRGGLIRFILGSFIMLSWITVGMATGATEIPSDESSNGIGISAFFHGVKERIEAASETPIPETADAVLIRSKEWSWNRYLKGALNLPEWMDLGLEHRTRYEVYDHPWRTIQPLGRTDPQIQQRSRVRFGLNGEFFKFLFEGQDSRVHLSDLSEFDFLNATIRNEYDILQVLVSATAKNVFGTGLRTDMHVGRLTMDVGSRRLIARNDFRNSTNAFDGFHWQLAKDKMWRLRAFFVQPVIRDQVQLDTQTKRFVFWGVYGETSQIPWLRMNTYYFGLNDQRFPLEISERTYSTFGMRLYENPQKSRIDYEIESTWQTGTLDDTNHFAHFQHLNLGYTFDLPWSPRLLLHYDYASGDRNPNDSQSSGFDTLFGARRFEIDPTGNFGPFFRRNINSPGWRVIVRPAKSWKVQLKQRFWYLATSRGQFSGSGLRDRTGGSGKNLGHDLEFRAQWKINDNLEFDGGYVHWFKGSYFERLPPSAGLPPGGDKDTDYFYILTKFRI